MERSKVPKRIVKFSRKGRTKIQYERPLTSREVLQETYEL